MSLDEYIKSISFQTNEIPGNDSFTTEFHKHFSNESLVLLDVYKSWEKIGTVDVASKTVMLTVIEKKGDKKDDWWSQTIYPYTTIFKNRLQKTLDTIIVGNQSATIMKTGQFYILKQYF